MARPIVLSNGEFHIGLNKFGLVHDFYFPYVGLENHAAGESMRHKVGIWVDGAISWLDEDSGWEFRFRYPSTALIGHTVARNDRIGVLLEFDDFVDTSVSAFVRNIHVVNLRAERRDIRLFMHQAFAIGDSRSNTDTAQYLPDTDAIVHYRGRRAFIVSGWTDDDAQRFDQYTVGLFGIEGHEGSYRDADDGELSFCNVEHGRVDSVLRFKLDIDGNSSKRVHYWIAAGTSMREALYIHKQIQSDGVHVRLHKTAEWWQAWLKPGLDIVEKLPERHRQTFLDSLMIIKSQIDKRGAVMASTDTTMLNYSRDAYAYCWPRDGAYVLWPLIRLGFTDEAYRFFEFCKRGMHPSGYLMHKYRADGALGSSWHPYVHDDLTAPPIQEDETALVLFVFAQFADMHDTQKLLGEFYESMVVPMADFLAGYVDETTHLPKASYDLWEEQFITSTYTTSVTYAALLAAVELAEQSDDADRAVRWRSVADDMYEAAHKHLYNHDRQMFYKGVHVTAARITPDPTIDLSSFFGSFIFGLFPLDGQEIRQAHATLVKTFGHNDKLVALPRYEGDNYRRVSETTPPNTWPITSMWLAQYALECGDTATAMSVLDFTIDHAQGTSMLAEQLHPIDGSELSVEPLTWSHAEYVSTLLDMISESK